MAETPYGYMGKVLRVDLTSGTVRAEPLEPELIDRYLGGTGFGAEYLYREVPPGVAWDDPENRIIMASGPVGGTQLSGAGAFALVTKGPMTNLAITSQAIGFWGAFLKFCGYDAVIIQGQSPRWVYLHIDDGTVALRDASSILGKDTWETEDAIRRELGETRQMSVFGIGPAGEAGVRYAVVAGDKGHVCSKNGCGAVMGAKRLKAVAVLRGKQAVCVYDKALLREKAGALVEHAKVYRPNLYKWGTGGGFSGHYKAGSLPVRNFTTNIYPEHEGMNGPYFRTHFIHKNKPCWGCKILHTKFIKVTEGPYTGQEGEEPEYEQMAAWGPVIGNTEPGAVVMLADLTDRLGMDANESGWVVAWVMECFEKGILTRADLDGLDMGWGNVEAVRELLLKISRREGIGDLLAEGVMRASHKVGGEAPSLGVYVLKGSTPRGHDHRARWSEFLETCVSATGSTQSLAPVCSADEFFGLPPFPNIFSPWEVAASNAKMDGWYTFIDSLVMCRFITMSPPLTMDCLNAITGRGLTLNDAMTIGRRMINQLRLFNLRHGLDTALEVPSPRYGSTPVDGPAKGISIMTHFHWMKSFYFQVAGWDPATGKPLPHTLRELGLERLIPDLEQ
ncbi:MAG: aldehyde ferredoxin oxidoreductase family protein [Syntrophales bacterium]